MQVQAAPLEGLGQLAGVVRGEEDERDLGGPDRPQLGDGHLVLGEDLEQERLGLELDAVDLVEQQHHRLGRADGLEQGSGEQELLREDVLLQLCHVWPASAWIRRSCFL